MSTPPGGRSIVRLASGSVLAALLAAGCAGAPGNEGSPGDPIVVRGTIYNKLGDPYAGATLRLEVVDHRGGSVGQAAPLALDAMFTSDFDGTFEIHLAPTDRLVALASGNGGSVEFTLIGSFSGESRIPAAVFSRQLAGSAWTGTPPILLLRPPAPTPQPTAEP